MLSLADRKGETRSGGLRGHYLTSGKISRTDRPSVARAFSASCCCLLWLLASVARTCSAHLWSY